MPRSHRPYPAEFRRRMVDLVRAGRTPESLGQEFEPTAQAIRNWVRQADRDEGRRPDGLTTAERDELRRLRRDNTRLREEREILKNLRVRRRRPPWRTRNSRWYARRHPGSMAVSLMVPFYEPVKKHGLGAVCALAIGDASR